MADRSRATPYRAARWSRDEDDRLKRIIESHGPVNWALISSIIRTRTAKQCRQRYYNYLDPTLNHKPITEKEARFIDAFYKKNGARWAECARELNNGRTDNAVKNYWNVNNNRKRRERFKAENCSCGHKETYHHHSHQYSPSAHSTKQCHPKQERSHYHTPSIGYEAGSTFGAGGQSQHSSYPFPAQMFAHSEKVVTDFRCRDEKAYISAASISSSSVSSNPSYALTRSSTGSDKLMAMTPPESSYGTDALSVDPAQGMSYGALPAWGDRLPPLSAGHLHISRNSHETFRDPFAQPILRSQVHGAHLEAKSSYAGHLLLPHDSSMGYMHGNMAPLPSPPISTSPYDSQGQASPSKDERMNINSLLQ